jgi:hypothetical protein
LDNKPKLPGNTRYRKEQLTRISSLDEDGKGLNNEHLDDLSEYREVSDQAGVSEELRGSH